MFDVWKAGKTFESPSLNSAKETEVTYPLNAVHTSYSDPRQD